MSWSQGLFSNLKLVFSSIVASSLMCNKRKIYKFLKFAEPKHQGAVWADWPEKWERKGKRCALHEVHVVNWNKKTNRNVPNQRWHCRAFVWQDLVTDASKNNIFFCMKAWLFSQQHACDANEKYTVYDGQSRLSSWTPHTDCAVTALSVNACKEAITLMEQN